MESVLELVVAAEKLFDDCDFPDKNEFLEIYNKFKLVEYVDTDLNLRMHSLYFFMKIYHDILNGNKPDDYEPMITNGTIQKYTGVKLNIDEVDRLYNNLSKNQIEKRNEVIESRVEISSIRLAELRKLCNSLVDDSFSVEEYYGKLCLYDHITNEYHFVELDESEYEWTEK